MQVRYLPDPLDTNGLLVHLAEECTEVAKQCMKALRFGLETRNPEKPCSDTNAQAILRELGDVEFAAQRLRDVMRDTSMYCNARVVGLEDENGANLHHAITITPFDPINGYRFLLATIHARIDINEEFVRWLEVALLPRMKLVHTLTWVDTISGLSLSWKNAIAVRILRRVASSEMNDARTDV